MKNIKTRDGRLVELEIDFCNCPEDSFFAQGTYLDTGEEVDEDMLDELTGDYAHIIDTEWFENSIGKAEDLWEGE